MSVRVRIAPAPSGSLHIGNARTALYNWLFARQKGGVFVLRVEDTDPSRVVTEHYQTIQDDLSWLGLDWDEGPGVGGPYGPYLQSERQDAYEGAADKLVDAGVAYRCYCTKEELEERRRAAMAAGRRPGYDGRCYRLTDAERAAFEAEGRPWALRIHVPPEGQTSFNDIVTGEVSFRHEDLDDIVIVRSDGRPLYNLAASVDDGLMEISHVIRGLDLQSSTPYQILIHQALGSDVPRYAHIPLVMGPGGQPLSKRIGGETVNWFKERGYLPDAMVNYLALLGWGTAEETILSREELTNRFELEQVHASPAMFDPEKLNWMNGEYIRMLEDAKLAELITPFFSQQALVGDPPSEQERRLIAAAAPLVKTRITRLEEAPPLVRSIFVEVEPDSGTVEKVLRQPYAGELLKRGYEALEGLKSWDAEGIGDALRAVQAEMGLGRKAYQVLYVAITGSTIAAPLFDLMEIIGKEKSLERLLKARNL